MIIDSESYTLLCSTFPLPIKFRDNFSDAEALTSIFMFPRGSNVTAIHSGYSIIASQWTVKRGSLHELKLNTTLALTPAITVHLPPAVLI
jgi:hypothetical protein